MENLITLSFIVPDSSMELIEKIKNLNPTLFKTSSRSAASSYNGYLAKREILDPHEFTHGLKFTDALLLDDLGGGFVLETTVEYTKPGNTAALFLQIPTPLGSSDGEERIFHAAILWARQNRIPSIGYELLPLDARWILTPSLPDGVITRTEESYEYMKQVMDHKNIWLLPFNEASIFSSVSNEFNLNGTKASYHYRNELKIPRDRTILYLPHNVAMIYEYREILKVLQPLGNRLHLMFSFGEDQTRGSHSHKDIVKTVYHKELEDYASFSFHNINHTWEMMMADSLVACSACFHTNIAWEKNIPSIIFDPSIPPMDNGNKKRVALKQTLFDSVQMIIKKSQKKCDLGDIMMRVALADEKNG
ncbi:MAG: hypothetical protein MI892_12740 [Desulfobacterales bacterium]|nr:hypothetical protein [Desulfobacterales bacterium]